MSRHGRNRGGVVDHLLTLLLAEAREANLREAFVFSRKWR